MGVLGLSAPLWIGAGALLLFCALLIARFTLALVHQVKSLRDGMKRANEILQSSLDEVRALGERAAATRAGISARRKRG